MRKKNYENLKDFTTSWYALSANRLLMTLGGLRGEVNSDVCIIGGGFTGLSAAYELVQRGYSVTLLEQGTIGSGASGKNGGHILRGFDKSPHWLTEKYGLADAKTLCNLTLEGLGLILQRVKDHEIKCDLKFGHLTAALHGKHIDGFKADIAEWEKIGLGDMQLLNQADTQALVKSKAYIGGLYDSKGAHFHPLNYLLGLAAACQKLGVKIYERESVKRIDTGDSPRAFTSQGSVKAKFIIVAGAIELPQMKAPLMRSITAEAHMIATEPLGEKLIDKILGKDIAVADANFVMNYYRLSNDGRMLFGGNCNYDGKNKGNEWLTLRARMLKVFPALAAARIDNCWHGPLDLTVNRLPDVGRLSPTVYYAHGFGGHGVIATNILGKVIADAVAGTAERFDIFDRIKHVPFAGGDLMKRPLFQLGILWYQLRDMLK